MIRIGPSGTDEQFVKDGHTSFLDMPEWLRTKYDLNLCEISFTYGVNVGDEFCKKLGENAKKYDVEFTAHAPFYINYANPDKTFGHKGNAYIISSLKKLKLIGGRKLCIHVGSQGKLERGEAIGLIKERLLNLKNELDKNELFDVVLCFEVMGKYSQIGNVEEIVEFAKLDRRFNLTLDVGHLNCIMQGALKTESDFIKIFSYIKENLPNQYNELHIHYSKVMYGEKGEIKHLDMSDTQYGPDFEPLARALQKLNMTPTIICESRGTIVGDSVKMQKIWNELLK